MSEDNKSVTSALFQIKIRIYIKFFLQVDQIVFTEIFEKIFCICSSLNSRDDSSKLFENLLDSAHKKSGYSTLKFEKCSFCQHIRFFAYLATSENS